MAIATIKECMDFVSGMEVAYDVDKVVENVKNWWNVDCEDDNCNKEDCTNCMFEKLIKIVKGAVKDE
jgi:hypothetical protein